MFLAAATLDEVMSAIGTIIAHLVGGTAGSGSAATTISFADSWVGSFLGTITSSNGLFFLGVVLSFCLFGIHVLRSLMGR